MESIYSTKESNHIQLHSETVQLKIFVNRDVKEAEKAISQWLAQNDVTIEHLAQSQSEKGGSFVFVMSVFYRENS